jgi:hypothetical protein
MFCVKWKTISRRGGFVICREIQNAPAILERIQSAAGARSMSRAR